MGAPVYPILFADAGVFALCAGRIYPAANIPEAITARPVVAYQTISGVPDNVLENHTPDDFVRVQINCWDFSEAGADALAEACRAAFENQAALIANSCGCRCLRDGGTSFDTDAKQYSSMRDFGFTLLR